MSEMAARRLTKLAESNYGIGATGSLSELLLDVFLTPWEKGHVRRSCDLGGAATWLMGSCLHSR
jgi:hypothetical protein